MPANRIRLFVFLCAALATGALRAAALTEARPLMGTVVEVAADGASRDALSVAFDAAYREMQRLSDMMNHYDPASVVSAINGAAGRGAVATPPELFAVLGMAQTLSAQTGGAFDVTVGALRGWRFRSDEARIPPPPELAAQRARVGWKGLHIDPAGRRAALAEAGMRIDLGGIAKLYILHAGMRVLAARGIERALVNGGGDVEVRGGTPERPWRVGVRDPRAPERLLGVLELRDGFVASSGDYERAFVRDGVRYHHILDPRSGYPSQGARGVTLTGGPLEDLNGLGVAIMVLGAETGRRLLAARPGVEAAIVERDGGLWMSPGFRAQLRAE
ncbi:MAG TPA: FAD:protein FMN transferase [Burkholderiales bacterium]